MPHAMFHRAGHWFSASVSVCALIAALGAGQASAAPLTWSLAFDQTVVSTSSETLSRSLRALALSSDNTSLYGGFIQKADGAGVQQFTLSGSPPVATAGAYFNVTTAAVGASGNLHQPKAVATDDRGLVYVGSSKDSTSGDNARIIIKNGSLSGAPQTVISLSDISFPGVTGERVGGLSVKRIAGVLYLYASREHPGSAFVERYVIGGSDVSTASLSLDASFGSGGRFNLRNTVAGANASDLRGLEVADDGTIFVTSRDNDAVYRISNNLATVSKQTVNNAIDLALFDNRVFVTSYDAASSAIVELADDMSLGLLSSFDAFGTFQRVGADGNVADTGYAGIDIDSSGRIYLADQLYLRSSTESRDRILVSSAIERITTNNDTPEPGTLALSALALGGAVWLRRRQHKA